MNTINMMISASVRFNHSSWSSSQLSQLDTGIMVALVCMAKVHHWESVTNGFHSRAINLQYHIFLYFIRTELLLFQRTSSWDNGIFVFGSVINELYEINLYLTTHMDTSS